jgi:DNA topoisomerase-3
MLILCEKPSVAGDFAEALRCGGRRGCYQNETVFITYCVGHLFELVKPESYHPSYRVWDATNLPIIPDKFRYKPIPDVASQTGIVLSLIRKYAGEDMVVATDAGREGELIAPSCVPGSGYHRHIPYQAVLGIGSPYSYGDPEGPGSS